MSWDDTQAAIAAAQAAYVGGSTAAASGDDSPQVYMGRTGGQTAGVTVRGPDPTVRPRRVSPISTRADTPEGQRPGDQGRVVSRSGQAIVTEDDIRTSDEAHGLMLAWHGTDKFTQWGQKLLGLGLIDAGDETSVEILDTAWQDAVDLSARFLASGKKITPWQAAELMDPSTAGGGSRYGSGGTGGGGFTGNRSSTSTSVDLTDPATAKAITNDTLSQALGRAARPEELTQFIQVINSAEKANPTVTSSTTRYDKGVDVSRSETKSGGLTGAGRSQMVLDRAQALPEYGAFQAASTYFNSLVSALDSPV